MRQRAAAAVAVGMMAAGWLGAGVAHGQGGPAAPGAGFGSSSVGWGWGTRFGPGAASASASGAVSASASASVRFDPGFAPDPDPLTTRHKWVYEIVYHEGAVFTPTPRARDAGKPTETPRRMGRFAIELYRGPDLIERVRFELPLLDGDAFTGKTRPRHAPPDLEKRVRVKMRVEVPATAQANRAVFLDRATGMRVRLPWPDQQPR